LACIFIWIKYYIKFNSTTNIFASISPKATNTEQIKIDKNTPLEERVIHMHFFMDGHDWYLSEYDPISRTFYGYYVPQDQYHRACWGRFNIDDLYYMRDHKNRRVTRNTDWMPRRAMDIDRVRDAHDWQKSQRRANSKAS